ncbi:valyl-tRNA synthetase [Cladorrhinum samala]|uniref:Valine--tRNA ligase, mitochondrial n=1 Tax=Cladorrhinum samala TaxID=585594 RepID=A0AAV9HDX5_9PEZI|nr:valyl-tRNA synthetase [Cladorrhinum samala]
MSSTPAPTNAAPELSDADKAKAAAKKAEKERQKAEKDRKFAEKQAKLKAAGGAGAAEQQPSKKKANAGKKAAEEAKPVYVDKTPKGEKKVLGPLDAPQYSAYHPSVVEAAWADWWEKQGFFEPKFTKEGEPLEPGTFVIPIPPPNVTGALHCGHALGTALQDVLIRWHRMRGFTTLYLPGCDHASISTQSVVENMLWRKEKVTRHDLGREKFLQRAMDWKEEYQGKINGQLRRIGGSFDWTREAFTMDEGMTDAVMEAFVRLHKEGLIYRANRLVNWCVQLNTTISNLEVDSQELTGRTLLDVPGYDRKVEFGVMIYFKYPVDGSDEFITVATTRIETMLGDTAVAVHPEDPRYKHLVGRNLRHPLIDRLIPVVADSYVDREFGTGAVKITPAHDPNDYAIGTRHNLPFINILNDDGTLNENTGKYAGQKRYDARYAVTQELTDLGLFVKKDSNPMTIRRCSRSKDIIEPLLKPQWWCRMKELAEDALDAVRKGDIKIKPESAEKSYFRWLENINDWCLSRQLWWGQQIPAYHVKFEGEVSEAEADEWIVARTEADAQKKAAEKYPGRKFTLERDPDVLDTWFSSGLWPFATLGWPSDTHDFQKLFPTSVLETGWDILFFWVARMIMLSLKLTGQVPFKEVFCHSLVRDAMGRKMSKSLGNVLDPIDVIEGITLQALQDKLLAGNLDPKELKTASESQTKMFPQGIPECGVDALRFSLINYTTGGGDINFDIKVMEGYRRFCNKIYQATKYVLGKLDADFVPPAQATQTGDESLSEKWIIHKLNNAAKDIHNALEEREFSVASQLVYQYWWNELCDVFIESSKALLQDGTPEEKVRTANTLYTALEGGLTLIHPFMPFLSEELWQRLPRRSGDATPSIVLAAYPQYKPENDFPEAADKYNRLLSCAKGIRSLLADYGVKQGGKAFIVSPDQDEYDLVSSQVSQIRILATKSLAELDIVKDISGVPSGCAVYTVSPSLTVYLDVAERVDAALVNKAKQKLARARQTEEKLNKLFLDEEWQKNTSAAVRDGEVAKLQAAKAEAENLEASIAQFEKLELK